MRNLFDFIVKNSYVFLFILLEIICFVFIYQSGSYRKWVMNSASKEISGPILEMRASYREYINLKNINELLISENKDLIHTAYNLSLSYSPAHIFNDTANNPVFEYVPANVIENTTHKQSNYIILDKGEKDSIAIDMGVITARGIVGIVKDVSPHFCIVLSLLHKEFSISAKLKRNDVAGILIWDGINHSKAKLKNISSIENLKVGDTVVTQHSLIFPENYPIGTVSKINQQVKGGYFALDILLFEQLSKMSKVWIIKNNYAHELSTLKEKVDNE